MTPLTITRGDLIRAKLREQAEKPPSEPAGNALERLESPDHFREMPEMVPPDQAAPK